MISMISPTLPRWATGRVLRMNISSSLTPRVLKRLRDTGKVGYRLGGKEYEYLTTDVLAALDEDSKRVRVDKGGNLMSKRDWKPWKNGQSCLQLVRGAQIRERPRNGGFSYDLIHREKVKNKKGETVVGRIPRVLKDATNRAEAQDAAIKLLAVLDEEKDTVFERSGGGVYKINEIVPKFLKDKKQERIDSYHWLEQIFKNRLIPFFGDLRMNEVSLRHQKDYRDKRREGGIADITIGKELAPLSSLYIFAADECLYDGANPVNIKKLKLLIEERERYMSYEEQALIWPELAKYPPLNDLVEFAYGTCMRPKNIVNDCTWNRIHWDEKEPYVFIPKNKHKNRTKDGSYLLTKKVLRILSRRYEESRKFKDFPYLFWRMENGKPFKITEAWIQRCWNEVLKNVGIREKEEAEGQDRLRFYDLKHTRLSRLGAKTGNVLLLKRISNHKDTKSLERYVKGNALNGYAMKALEEDDGENG